MKDRFTKEVRHEVTFGIRNNYSLQVVQSEMGAFLYLRDNNSKDAETVKIMPSDVQRLIGVLNQAMEKLDE